MAAVRPEVVGGFILGGLALAVAAILFFGGTRLFAGTSTAVVLFSGSVAGLEVGAPVTFRGVRVGSVVRITLHFSPNDLAARIPVFLEIEPDRIAWEGEKSRDDQEAYRKLAKAGLRAQLVMRSFVTGQAGVDLDFRPGTPAILTGVVPGMPEIPSVPSDFEHMRNELTELPLRQLVETAQHTLATMDRLTARIDTALDPLAQDAHRTADSVVRTFDEADDAVRRLRTEVSATLRELDKLLADSRRQITLRGEELGHTAVSIDRAARQAEALAAAINGMAAPKSGFRDDLEAAAHDLADSASALRGFSRALERDPSAVLTGKTVR